MGHLFLRGKEMNLYALGADSFRRAQTESDQDLESSLFSKVISINPG